MGVTSAKPKLWLQLLYFLVSIDSGFGGPRCPGNSPVVAQSPSPGALPPPTVKTLTVMVFSLLCFLLGDEDPRFW